MTAKVIYLPYKFSPDFETIQKLDFIQEQLELYHAELAFKTRDFSPGNRLLFKQASHKAVRATWELIEGGRIE